MTASETQINGLRRGDDPVSLNSDMLFFEVLTPSSEL